MDGINVPAKPWTGASIKALRDEIARGGEEVPGLSYQAVYVWYSQVLLDIVDRLNRIDYPGIIGKRPEISFRVKTVDTLRDKLIRQDNTPLFRIHDIIGARITADMSLAQQDDVVDAIASLFPKHQISDMREHPHSGYRAVHVIARLPRGIFAEIQVRTLLQDAWANCYEALADRFGRRIRYEQLPGDKGLRGVVESMQELSLAIGKLESMGPDSPNAWITGMMVPMLRSSAEFYRTLDPRKWDQVDKLANDMVELIRQRGGNHGGHGDSIQQEDR